MRSSYLSNTAYFKRSQIKINSGHKGKWEHLLPSPSSRASMGLTINGAAQELMCGFGCIESKICVGMIDNYVVVSLANDRLLLASNLSQ